MAHPTVTRTVQVNTSTLDPASVLNYDPTGSVYALVTRPVGTTADPEFDQPMQPVRAVFGNNAVGAFGNLIVTDETPVVALAFNYNINSWFVVTGTVDGGTVTQSSSMAVMQTSAGSTGSAYLSSRMGARYNPGQGLAAKFTAIFTTGALGDCVQEIGLGDDSDGFFFCMSGSNFGVVRRRSGVDEFVSQSAWNGPDRYDGTGPGAPLRFDLGNVYTIRYQWLGFGAIKFFIEDPGTGRVDLVHTIEYANGHNLPSIFNPTLVLHAHATNRGNTSNVVLKTPSMGAYIEGPHPVQTAPGSFARPGSVAVAATEVPVLSLRVTGTFQGKNNRVRTKLTQLASYEDGNAQTAYTVRIRINSTLTTPTWTPFDASTSTVNTDTGSLSVSGGRCVHTCLIAGGTPGVVDLAPQNLYLNPGDQATVTAQNALASGSNSVVAALDWEEEFNG